MNVFKSSSFFITFLIITFPQTSMSEIVRDGSIGVGSTNLLADSSNTYSITQDMGNTVGQTLLHSFDVFNIDTGETANFTGDALIQNIISRVTGDDLSTINGTINSLIEGANFYFINPNGIIIGPDGEINISGSADINLSTSTQLLFDNGEVLYADDINQPLPILQNTTKISQFGFLGNDAGDIEIHDNFVTVIQNENEKRKSKIDAESINLNANTVNINNSVLGSNDKVLIIANDVMLDNAKIEIEASSQYKASIDIQSQTDIDLKDSILITNSGNTEKGKISLLAGTDIRFDDSDIFSQSFGGTVSSDVYIHAQDGDFSMSGPDVSAIVTRANNGDTTTNIDINANNVYMRDGARIQNLQGFGLGAQKQDMGNITITAKENFSMSGFSNSSSNDRAIIQATNDYTLGDGGDITITAGDIEIQDRGFILAAARGTDNNGGKIQLTATSGDITISNRDHNNIGRAGSLLLTNGSDGANAGDIILNAENNINLLDHAIISAGSIARGVKGGKAGDVSINAGNTILLAGKNDNSNNPDGAVEIDYRGSRIQAQASNGTDADAGNIRLAAENIELRDEATILNNSTFGNGGDITIDAIETLTVDDSLLLASTRLLEDGDSGGEGNAGNITLSANKVNLDQAHIESKSVSGNGGDIMVDISHSLLAANKTLITTEAEKGTGGHITVNRDNVSTSPQPNSLIFIDTEIKSKSSQGEGDGGNVSFESKQMLLWNSDISADTDIGAAGDISFDNVNTLALIGNNSITVNSSPKGTPGAILESDLTINEEGLLLPEQLQEVTFVDASSLLRQSCSAYQPASQFTILKQPGIAASPDGLLPSIDPVAVQVASAVDTNSGQLAQNQGVTTYRSGKLGASISHWIEAVSYYAETGEMASQNDALRGTAQVQQALGEYNDSVATLAQAVDIARRGGDQKRLAESLGSLGNALIASGKPGSAQDMLEKAVDIAEETQDLPLTARLRNNLGNYYSANNNVDEAIGNYLKSIDASIETDQYVEAAKAYANIARLKANHLETAAALGYLTKAEASMNAIEPTLDKANLHIHLAKSYHALAHSSTRLESNLMNAYNHLERAKSIGQQTNDDRLLSHALGNIGSLYQTETRIPEALILTRQALSLAEKINAPESLYRWHWQEGQLLHDQGKTQAAINAYRRAITIIEDTRQTTLARYESANVHFKQQVQPVYRELADILIKSSVQADNPLQAQQLLRNTRDIIEQLKTAELENYFHDDCIANFEAKRKNLDDVSPKTAIVYPIVLKERIELLVSLPDPEAPSQRLLTRQAVPIDAETLNQSVNDFRHHIETLASQTELQKKARSLYSWLVEPYVNDLEKYDVDTIVFVPDGSLRTLPVSALHNGHQYLIENFAIAITSSLTLIDPRPLSSTKNQVLLAGVSEAINNFPALQAVPGELDAVKKLYGGDILLDNEFTADAFTNKVKNNNYSIIHIASHAQFTGDDRNSFLQAHDQPLFMEGLKSALSTTKYRDKPLEMLVLSACQTASGDERAALGLAGVGIKAGARSAMGSLWNIGDDSAAELVEGFYTELQKDKQSKAEALRQAQLSLLRTEHYTHPAHWSAFMLIDNWL